MSRGILSIMLALGEAYKFEQYHTITQHTGQFGRKSSGAARAKRIAKRRRNVLARRKK